MNRLDTIYFIAVLLGIAGVTGLVGFGSEKIVQSELIDIRLMQLRHTQNINDQTIAPLVETGSIFLSDYFINTSEGYEYLGGVFDSPWKVGEIYSLKEIESAGFVKGGSSSLLGLLLAGNTYYINVDQGNDETVKEFLHILDKGTDQGIDSLFLDFRFMRKMEFGPVIRLFNQIAPREKITFGTILTDYQKEEIVSSGQPFFTIDHTIFIVCPSVPAPVKSLIRLLSSKFGYEVLGELGSVPDTACLFTEYKIGSHKYRTCSEKWMVHMENSSFQHPLIDRADSIEIPTMLTLDELWYKNRDTQAMRNQLRLLLP